MVSQPGTFQQQRPNSYHNSDGQWVSTVANVTLEMLGLVIIVNTSNYVDSHCRTLHCRTTIIIANKTMPNLQPLSCLLDSTEIVQTTFV